MLKHLPKEDGESIMPTIAESYIQRGMERGKQKGRQEAVLDIVMKMIKEKIDVDLIASISGLSKEAVIKLKSKA